MEKLTEILKTVNGIVWGYPMLILIVGTGGFLCLTFVWLIADTLNAMMAIPELIALVILIPVVFQVTREYFRTQDL